MKKDGDLLNTRGMKENNSFYETSTYAIKIVIWMHT